MLAIRLQRIGKKHQPSFRIVVAERRSKLVGPPVEDLGSYNPSTKAINAEKDRVAYWIQSGAEPTPTVWNLLVKSGAVTGKKIAIKIHPHTNLNETPSTSTSTRNTATPPQSPDDDIIGVGVKKPVKVEAVVEAPAATAVVTETPTPTTEAMETPATQVEITEVPVENKSEPVAIAE